MTSAALPVALPRALEADARSEEVRRVLGAQAAPMWAGGSLAVAHLPLTAPLAAALARAARRGFVRRGLEAVTDALDAQRTGLLAGQDVRVSRLLLCTDDGAERFYRGVERVLRDHAPRVLGAVLGVDGATLGRLLFGADATAKLVLVEHKDAVSDVLLALASPSHAGSA